MSNWSAPQRPNTYAEQMLISAVLDGTFRPGTTLPGERTLAAEMGITRPTLREAIQRLARDGWLTVRQGKPTVVNNYWREGGLNVLSTLVQHGDHLPPGFVANLLEVRLQLAPAYTRAAVDREPLAIAAFLDAQNLPAGAPGSFAEFDWRLHRRLTYASGNPIYTLILNGFGDFYEHLAPVYFHSAEARSESLKFYNALALAAGDGNAGLAEEVCREAMLCSIEMWKHVRHVGSPHDSAD